MIVQICNDVEYLYLNIFYFIDYFVKIWIAKYHVIIFVVAICQFSSGHQIQLSCHLQIFSLVQTIQPQHLSFNDLNHD